MGGTVYTAPFTNNSPQFVLVNGLTITHHADLSIQFDDSYF